MNIVFIGKRAGQCGVSTVATMFSTFLSYNGRNSLYIPLSEDINDVLSWFGIPIDQDITKSISRISSFIQGGSTQPNDVLDSSLKIDDKLYLLDTREKTLTDKFFMDVIKYIVSTNVKDNNASPFKFIVWDLSHERRTDIAKEYILDEADVIIDVRTQNETIYIEEEHYLNDYRDKIIMVDNKTSPNLRSKYSILDYILAKSTKKINIRLLSTVQKSQNNYDYYKCCQNIFKKPDSKGLPVLNNLKLLLKEVYKYTR